MPTDVKRPAYQWYPGDFRRDVAVQACSFEARALWREMLDLMHDGEPYGYLTAGGVSLSVEELGRFVGVPLGKVRRWLGELEARKVFSRTELGVIYSRRMVKDEHIRTVRAAAGKQGGNPALRLHESPAVAGSLLNQTANQTTKQKPTPAVAVASALAETPSPSPSPDVARLLAAIPQGQRLAWDAEINVARQGMHGPALTEEQIDRACRDFYGNGGLSAPNLNHFRSYLRTAAKALTAHPRAVVPFSRPSKQEVGRQNLQDWLNEPEAVKSNGE